MNKYSIAAVAAAVVLGTTAVAVSAQQGLKLTTASFQEVEVVGENGKREKKTVPAVKVVPGTEVLYAITFENAGSQSAEAVVINNPVPKELRYVDGSAFGAGTRIEMSVDEGKAYGPLESLTVPGDDGQPRPATAADVTNLRWTLEFTVNPGDQGRVTYRAVLQ